MAEKPLPVSNAACERDGGHRPDATDDRCDPHDRRELPDVPTLVVEEGHEQGEPGGEHRAHVGHEAGHSGRELEAGVLAGLQVLHARRCR